MALTALLARNRSVFPLPCTSKLACIKANRFLSANSEAKVEETAPEKKKRAPRLRANRPILQKRRAINTTLDEAASSSGLGWRLMSSTILHRYPPITPDPEEWEKAMWELEDKINKKKREWLVEQLGGTDAQIFPTKEPTYEEILAMMPFQPASRVTEADEKNDRRSVERRLQDSLFLIVKRNRTENQWQFPQGKLLAEETFRLASERVIDRTVGGKVNRWFVGNAPIGHFCYEYPKELQEQRKDFGAKVFFYRAQIISGTIKLNTKLYKDYAWIARDELGEYFDAETAEYLFYALPH